MATDVQGSIKTGAQADVQRDINWGIIGPGKIARKFAEGLLGSDTGRLVAVASRQLASAEAFCDDFPARAYGDYEALLADPEVEVVYIATPHPAHAEWAIKAAEAGKHLLCEKPLAVNEAEAATIVEAARANGVFLMEAFMYRCHPQTTRLVELLGEGVIGRVQQIRASFGYRSPRDLASRTHSHVLAGGGILDVGCYPASMSRLIAGVANGQPYCDPISFKATGIIGTESRVDHATIATAVFPGEIVATLETAVEIQMENHLRIIGTEGSLLVPEPWQPGRSGAGFSKIIVFKDGIPGEYVVEEEKTLYAIEADHVGELLRAGKVESPVMTWGDTLSNMRMLDAWRREIGLAYDWE